MYHLVKLILLSSAIRAGYQYVGANGKSHEQIDQQIDQCSGRTYRSQSLVADKLPHHHDIRSIEQKLQNTG